METVHQPTPALLETSISHLHQESKNWVQEIELWRNEFSFFQKLLESIAPKAHAVEDKKQIDHFQHLITYFQGELLDQFAHDVRLHENYLQKLGREDSSFQDQPYREQHQKQKEQLAAFALDYRQYRQELFQFAEQYL
ncbi:hypothetical protein [Rufibacter quisquiliarum]|uniref:Uncharacterized protein n=1 Tax=Rufibacter quisquiliarum TaxID=1549639 RepID=A0A839GKM9_9BACT|nr:hypothetical protein [Rufibacter quisquiliarum]MBA9079220.1 hypothetical protein [Rufibacter quisquiliarum]